MTNVPNCLDHSAFRFHYCFGFRVSYFGFPSRAEIAMSETAVLKGQRDDVLGTGRRKTSCARVRLRPGKGVIVINDRPLDDYFKNISNQNAVVAPLMQTGKREL